MDRRLSPLRRVLLSVATLLAVVPSPARAQPQTSGPVLSVEGDHFQVDGQAKFLYFVSFFDGVREAAISPARLEEDLDYIRHASCAQSQPTQPSLCADGLRVFPNWWLDINTGQRGNDTLFNPGDSLNPLRPAPLAALKLLLERASARGLVVDVTFSRETLPGWDTPSEMTVENYKKAIVAAALHLRAYRNVLFDIQNQFNQWRLQEADIESIRIAINAPDGDPHRIVTTAFTENDNPRETGRFAAQRGLWVAAHHDARNKGRPIGQPLGNWWEEQTLNRIASEIRIGAAAFDVILPIYLQEPMAWGTQSRDDPVAGHHRSAAKFAKKAGIAAWTFHQRVGFNLQTTSFKSQIFTDAGMRTEMEAIRPVINAETWGASTTDETDFYHLDALGSVRAVTDQTGTVRGRHEYLAFGEEYLAEAGVERRRFTGKERDAETGLDYFGARYYMSRAGRFTSVDPVLDGAAAVLDPQQWNRYAYAANNPLRFIDPDGRRILLARSPWREKWYAKVGAFRDSVAAFFSSGDPDQSTPERLAEIVVDSLLATVLPRNDQEAMPTVGFGVAGLGRAQLHHIATNKSLVTGWTAAFKKIFDRAGVPLNDRENIVALVGHAGRHAKDYHQYVFETLRNATRGLSGDDYRRALVDALRRLRKELLENPKLVKGEGIPK